MSEIDLFKIRRRDYYQRQCPHAQSVEIDGWVDRDVRKRYGETAPTETLHTVSPVQIDNSDLINRIRERQELLKELEDVQNKVGSMLTEDTLYAPLQRLREREEEILRKHRQDILVMAKEGKEEVDSLRAMLQSEKNAVNSLVVRAEEQAILERKEPIKPPPAKPKIVPRPPAKKSIRL